MIRVKIDDVWFQNNRNTKYADGGLAILNSSDIQCWREN